MTREEHRMELTNGQIEHINKYPNLKALYNFKIDKREAVFSGLGCQHKAKEFKKLIERV